MRVPVDCMAELFIPVSTVLYCIAPYIQHALFSVCLSLPLSQFLPLSISLSSSMEIEFSIELTFKLK